MIPHLNKCFPQTIINFQFYSKMLKMRNKLYFRKLIKFLHHYHHHLYLNFKNPYQKLFNLQINPILKHAQ